jgi:predicted acetyltransferase
MPDSVILQLTGEKMYEALYMLNNYAFHASPPFPNKEEFFERMRQREVLYYACIEDGTTVAGAASGSLHQNVRGKIYPISGIWGVATHPAARRKGYSKNLIRQLLETEYTTGKVFTALHPFRDSFYERLGYVSMHLPRSVRFKTAALAPLVKMDLDGHCQLMLLSEGYEIYRDYLFAMQASVHGMALFDHSSKANIRNDEWLLLVRRKGKLEGLMIYRLNGAEITHFTLCADRFLYRTSQAKYRMLGWMARHVDQAEYIEIRLTPYEYPETWLPDLDVKYDTAPVAPMVRVLNVVKLSGMHTNPGNFSATITDPLCPWNEKAWHFESTGGILQVSETKSADAMLPIQGLTALVFGSHDPEEFTYRCWGDPTPQQQEAMRSLFPRLIPYIHEWF